MSAVVDTSVLIDYLRGHEGAARALETARNRGALHASEITRVEILAGMRAGEEPRIRLLFAALDWHPVNADVAEEAGRLGQAWLRSHSGIDSADLAIAATARVFRLELVTTNVRHFPMFAGLRAPY